MKQLLMNPEVLKARLKELGWSQYRLAQELDKLRGEDKGAGNYTSTVKKVLGKPEDSKAKTLEDLIKAMGGELIVRWEKTEQVIVSYEEVKLSD
jgi:hypothetical protein